MCFCTRSFTGIISEFGSHLEHWSEFGEYYIGNRTTFDLFIEVFENENTL